MRRFILAASAIAALGVAALAPALASADVQRSGPATLTSTVTYQGTQYVHTYNVNITGSSFTGTGIVGSTNEKISGTINGSTISFTATYQDGSGYTWRSEKAGNGTDSLNQHFTVTNVLTDVYKNHGDYVSSQGGGADVAHSDIGMPINSGN